MPVISAPDSVVGIAATRAPVTAAIAFAVSITRPPPRATRCGGAGRVEQGRRGLGHAVPDPPGQLVDGGRGLASCRRAGQVPRGREQLEGLEAVLGEQLRRVLDAAGAEDDRAAGVPPDEVAVHPAEAVRGLTTGRRFGSTSARRCS